ncbi:MAG: RNA chaperone Hfq [Leptospiraceae bacterium]|nr:RNA chaperone Hfq [Leptospiraceae bacterium]MCB1318218.1 RNA chaperone Hfq [Leptospiraceae bacterium]
MPNAPQRVYQDRILETATKRNRPITVYLKNGVHIKGRVLAHDMFTILLETDKNKTLVYKHSATSIFPARMNHRKPHGGHGGGHGHGSHGRGQHRGHHASHGPSTDGAPQSAQPSPPSEHQAEQ